MNIHYGNAINKINKGRPPIWFMRQAGRYHDHYQALKAHHSFEELCKKSNLAAQVALGPVMDFGFDTAILFSDILFPLEALGRTLEFTEKGPKLGEIPNVEFPKLEESLAKLQFQFDAVKETRALLPNDRSLVGFIGGPWTLFTYWMEQTHQGPLLESKKNLSYYPTLMEHLGPILENSIENQLKNGAEVVMIFDTSAGELSPKLFDQLVTPWIYKWTKKFPQQIIYYARGVQASFYTADLWRRPSDLLGMGFDWRWNLREAFELFPDKVIQGNFDQSLLFLPTFEFQKYFNEYLEEMRNLPNEYLSRWIMGLGHGVLPKTPQEHVRWMIQRTWQAWS
jgi:uroporphyrinogen decarboxylase